MPHILLFQATLVFFQSLGNHEFDEAVDGVVPFIRNLSSPVLAANLILDKVPELKEEPNMKKSIVIVKDGVKIGIIGYLTPETKFLAPKNLVEYEDEITAIRTEVKKLKYQGIDILIALGHSGFMKDLEIAKYVEDIDLVIGGHSNTFLVNSNSTNEIPEQPQGPYPTEVRQPSGRIVRVVQAYAYTKYLGKLHLIFDSNGEIIECDGTPMLLNQEIPRDQELLNIVNQYRSSIERINNVIFGSSRVALHGEYCRLRECNIGDLITDAMLNYTKENLGNKQDVNIAIIQGGRIRASIDRPTKPFNMTRGDWVTVLPFTDTLKIVTLNGSILRQALEHAVKDWRTIDSVGQFLQFSGMRVIYDLAKPPQNRVAVAKAVCSGCGVTELDDVKDNVEYKLVMNTFLAESGDGFTMFEGLPNEVLSYNEIDCITHYLNVSGPVTKRETGRLLILNEDKAKTAMADFTFDGLSKSNSDVVRSNGIIRCTTVILAILASLQYL